MKIKKQGFTLVEIMIVVAIIGLLAAIGIPSILNAYSGSQKKAKLRNVAEVEKAKGVLTLPTSSLLPGAMGLADTTTDITIDTATGTNLCYALSIADFDALTVGDDTIDIGSPSDKASYINMY